MTAATKKATKDIQKTLKGTNINEKTFLATDYLNHFNEAVMMLEMVPDMPELLDEVKSWQPKTYQEHFGGSVFKDKDLAVEAYEAAPDKFRIPFDLVIRATFSSIRRLVKNLDEAILAGQSSDALREMVQSGTRTIGEFLDQAGGIIHGQEKRMAQADIDTTMGTPGAAKEILVPDSGEKTSSQNDIDALFD